MNVAARRWVRVQAVHRAIDAYTSAYAWWRGELTPRAMRQDWSWARSAQQYLAIYRDVCHHA
jgi:glycogen synthase